MLLKLLFIHKMALTSHCYTTQNSMSSLSANHRTGRIRCSGTRKSMLLKVSSGERCATHNFVLVTLLNIAMNIKTKSGTAILSAFFL